MRHSRRDINRLNNSRRGAALLFCMFILFFSAMMVIHVLDSTTLELAALRNTMDYERALYLANAGVHEVAARIEANENWRGIVTDGSYPADNTYTASAVDGANSTIIVTATGVAGDVSRNLEAILESD